SPTLSWSYIGSSGASAGEGLAGAGGAAGLVPGGTGGAGDLASGQPARSIATRNGNGLESAARARMASPPKRTTLALLPRVRPARAWNQELASAYTSSRNPNGAAPRARRPARARVFDPRGHRAGHRHRARRGPRDA